MGFTAPRSWRTTAGIAVAALLVVVGVSCASGSEHDLVGRRLVIDHLRA